MKIRVSSVALLISLFSLSVCQAQLAEYMEQIDKLKDSWEKEQAAIEQIEELGGWVKTENCLPADWQDQFDEDKRKFVIEVNMVYNDDGGVRSDNSNMSDDALAVIANFTQVKRVLLKSTQASDEELRHLAKLENIEAIFICDGETVTDEGVKHFANLKKLKKLHLSKSLITDDAIGHLKHLKNIENLSLQRNAFTNKVLEYAGEMKKLNNLWVGLGDNTIDDDGLKHLYGLKKLRRLGIQQTGVTDEGVAELRRQLPDLDKIYK